MSKSGASPEFERRMQEIAAKHADMFIPRNDAPRPIAESRFPAWTEEQSEPIQVIPDDAVEAAMYAWGFSAQNIDERREMVRRILEAAAPHLMAPVLALADKWQADFPDKARQLREAIGEVQ